MTSRLLRFLLATLLTALLGGAIFLACKQKEGESCQTTSDCDENLVCCFDGAGSVDSLGVCTPGDNCTPIDASVPDAEVTPDASG